jgi:quercetin dioxygenase-like cupin family protein
VSPSIPAGRAAYRRPTASSTSSRDRPRSRSAEKTRCSALAKHCLSLLGRPSLSAGSGAPSILLYFLLAPAAELDRPTAIAPATVTELYRTVAPIPDLKPGGYDLNLTRVTFPPGMPSNPPHHRSGAALYYVVSGTGATTVDGTTKTRGSDSLIYEPFGLVHQWGNPGGGPLTFLAFNINPDGVAAVLPDAPAKAQWSKTAESVEKHAPASDMSITPPR